MTQLSPSTSPKMTTHQATAEKACQLKEKQAAELVDAHKMEEQHLGCIAKKKERDCLRKIEEDARKQCKDEEQREKEEAAIVLPAQPPEKESMDVDHQPSPGINALLSNMMQGTNEDEERENINLETRSHQKNKQRNDGPSSKPSAAASAAPKKSAHTKLDKHIHKFPRVVVEGFIKLSDTNPFQEFVVGLQNLLKNGQLVDPFFTFCPINTGGLEKKIHESSGIPINMTMLGAHFKISSNG
jgi:hypothetical protein